jgi:hypothetical protein
MTATERAVKIEEALGRWASLEWVKAGIEGRAAIDALRAALAVVPEPPTLCGHADLMHTPDGCIEPGCGCIRPHCVDRSTSAARMENGEFPTLTGDALEDYQRRMTSPTLAERIAAPGFDAEVDRARALLDAKDAGWNEGVEAAISACNEVFRVQAMCGQRGTSDGASLCTLEVRSLLIPTVPPSKEKP